MVLFILTTAPKFSPLGDEIQSEIVLEEVYGAISRYNLDFDAHLKIRNSIPTVPDRQNNLYKTLYS